MRFRKYHGIGNDFVMLTDLHGRLGPPGSLPKGLVAALCDRHTGVGGDGVIRILADDEARAAGAVLRMDYYNADGGAAEMCGNGIRCLAVLAHRLGVIEPGEHTVLTGAGPLTVRLQDDGLVTVDMGVPGLTCPEVPMAGEGSSLRVGVELEPGRVLEGTGVSMGNPHFVLFEADTGLGLGDDAVHGIGPRLETHPAFPERTNVEFVEVLSPRELRMRVWERGVGETMACGTGACAVAVAAAALERAERSVTVRLPGGDLEVEWAADDRVWMTGPAEEVFEGELHPDWLRARDLTDASLHEEDQT